MRFDPQSGFMPDNGSGSPLSTGSNKTVKRAKAPKAGLRPSVMIVIAAVTCVLGVWMWREAVYGPQTASADQMAAYLPGWLKQTLNIEDTNEETTVLRISTPNDAPPGVRSSATFVGDGIHDTQADDSAATVSGGDESAGHADEPQRRHLTLGPSDSSESDADSGNEDSESQYGLSFQPPFKAKQAYEKGMAKSYYGRHRDAAAQFKEAIRIDPEFAQARYQLGLSLVRIDDIEGARVQHTALVKLHPQYAAKLARKLP